MLLQWPIYYPNFIELNPLKLPSLWDTMYYNDKGVVDYGHPGDKVYSPRSARVKIFSDEEEYKKMIEYYNS